MSILKILVKRLRSNLRLVEGLRDGKTPPAFLAIPLSLIFANLQLGMNMVYAE